MSIPEYESFSQHQKDIITNILSDKTTKRKRILGSAGSGKTMIMSYCASKLAAEGKYVLMIIYNKTLLRQIRYMVNNYYNIDNALFANNDIYKYVTIDNYHHFLWNQINDTDKFADLEYTNGKKELTQEQINGYLLGNESFIKYDYIFIDEMQDLKPNSILNLIKFLEPSGKLVVFADKYQHIYDNNQYEIESIGENSNVPAFPKNSGFIGKWTRLTEVFRSNSIIQQKGIEYAKKYLFPLYGEETINLSGELIDSSIDYYTSYSDSALIKAIKAFSTRQLANTAILVHELSEVTHICELLDSHNIDYISILKDRRQFNVHLNKLTISTVKSFKGLEAQNVIYVNNANNVDVEDNFVAITRAIKKLIIFDTDTTSTLYDIYKFAKKPIKKFITYTFDKSTGKFIRTKENRKVFIHK